MRRIYFLYQNHLYFKSYKLVWDKPKVYFDEVPKELGKPYSSKYQKIIRRLRNQ